MNIILTGYMGTGKTAVAQKLQKLLNWKVVDTDTLIVQQENRSINEIFKSDGEDCFRKVESEIIKKVSKLDKTIISTGGGVVLNKKNITNLKKNGLVVCLTANAEVIFDRLKNDDTRPLLNVKDPIAKIKKMLKSRAEFYANNNYEIDTSKLTLDKVAEKIITFMPETIDVKLKENSYKIYVGKPFTELVHFLPYIEGKKILVISDEHVAEKYLVKFMATLKDKFDAEFYLIPSGEEYKNLEQINLIYKACIDHKMDRGSLIIALGGGVVGDMAGFAAATFLRGIRFVQVPTTLLAQVDAGIGGKTGIDLEFGKNLVGAFHQPSLVWIDPAFLNTLDDREYKNGLAEVVKYGVIISKKYWDFFEKNIDKILNKDEQILQKMLFMCAKAKADVVSKDEKEAGVRKILNFGHTLGHALETRFFYTHKHGEMVAVGMIFAAHLGYKLGFCDKTIETKIKNLLIKILPEDLIGLINRGIVNAIRTISDGTETNMTNELIEIMTKDKKMYAGKIDFILPKSFGEVTIQSLDLEIVKNYLENF